MRLWTALLLLASLAPASEESLATFDACWRHVRKHYYDRDRADIDWDGVRATHRARAAQAGTRAETRAALEGLLADLDASHAAILEDEAYRGLMAELRNRRYWTFGIVLEEARPGELFLRAAYEGGPAARAGLLLGDRVVSIEGANAIESDHLLDAGYDRARGGSKLFFLSAAEGKRLRLVAQRTPDRTSRNAVVLAAAWMNGVDAAKHSARAFSYEGFRLGYFHVWYCSLGVAEALEAALEGPLAGCDALVVDLRGRGGWSQVGARILDLLERRPELPAVFLTDERTRSAKEVMAYRIRRREAGPIVGRRTAGAVLGAGFFPLPDQTWVELPIANVRVDGVRLEGVGVEPDHRAILVLPFAGGRDAIFRAGCEVAVKELRRQRGWTLIRLRRPPIMEAWGSAGSAAWSRSRLPAGSRRT